MRNHRDMRLFVCLFCADGIMITNKSNNYYVFLNVIMFRIMSMTLREYYTPGPYL